MHPIKYVHIICTKINKEINQTDFYSIKKLKKKQKKKQASLLPFHLSMH